MSSSPNSFHSSFDSREPRQELDSPFLNEKFLAEEARTAPTWRTSVPGFQLESPFLEAFEEGWGAIAELEEFDELEAEEFDELEEDFDDEEELFEFQASAPIRDYSLKAIADGTLGNAPNDIRSEILNNGNQDTNALTYKVFWQRYPALNGMMLDRKDPRQKKLREEWSRILNRQIKPLIWLRGIVELLDKYRGDIPREFLLGWMAVESDGKVTTKTKRPEHGYFQIDWKAGEAQEQLKLSEKNFLRLSSDREYSIQMGVKLAQIYRRYLLDRYSLTDGTELLWHLTKARHGASGTLKSAMDKLVREGKDITWSAVSGNMSATKVGRLVINNVNKVFHYAALLKPIADLVPSPPVTTPEVSAPPFKGEWGAISEPEVEESDEFLDELQEEEFEEEELIFETKEEEPASVETLKQEIVRLAQEQLKRWKSGVLREADADSLNILKEYYRNCGVKVSKKDKLGDRKWHCKNPWSAVFVSWIMKQAGAGNKFRYSRSHQWYIIEAKKNHDKQDKDKPFWAFSVTEIAPEVGDLVCRDRPCGECDDCSGATFENIDKPKGKPTHRCTHCDIVTEKHSSSNEIVVIGGNLGDSVREQVIKIDTDGKVIPDREGCKFFAVITLKDRTSDSSSSSKEFQEEAPELESWSEFFNELDTEVEEWESKEELKEELDEYPFELQIDTPPIELKLAEHFHLPKSLPDGKVDVLTRLKPDNLNPGYIDSAIDELQVDRTADSFQIQLENLIKTKYKKYLGKTRKDDKIRIVLVDLTNDKLYKPDFAGWGSTISTYGASIPKICAVYSAFQLRCDLNRLAAKSSISKKEDLIEAATNSWQSIGFSSLPKLDKLFNFKELPTSVSLEFSPDFQRILNKIDDNCAMSKLILLLGFPYIASVIWQSGLRHPTRGGLWLAGGYCCRDKEAIRRLLNSDTNPYTKNCSRGLSFRWKNPIREPKPTYAHNITALSVATFFTLLAQGRLVDERSSQEISAILQNGCFLEPNGFGNGLSRIGGTLLTRQKCGISRDILHESVLVKRDQFHYVAVALTINAADFPFDSLIKDLDKLIQDKNP